jgi:5-methyltetrahydropteroyltriglutamate--homocysteine methyltransferase
MEQSRDRFLTTHAGSLPKPEALTAAYARHARGELLAAAAVAALSESATAEVVAQQIAIGLDVINNGEVGRDSFITYLQHRMSGFGGQSQRKVMADLTRYPGYLERLAQMRGAKESVSLLRAPQALAEVRYLGTAAIAQECEQLARLLAPHAGRYREAFVSSPSPGIVAAAMQNAFYDDLDSYVNALGEQLAIEYRAIVEHGFLLQIDAPDLALERHTLFQDKPLADFLAFARVVIAAINRALAGIPPERVRLHVCWGNYEGPHDSDVPLADIWPVIEQVRAHALLLSLANPRHCHEHRWFERGCLPEGVLLIPGVIDTTTNYVEHPEAVADRLERIAAAVGDPTRIIAGTDCGLESSAGNSMLSAPIAWAKLRALTEGAALASTRVWGSPPHQ